MIDRKERVARLAQLRTQASALMAEITRLEREDDQYAAYVERALAASQTPLSYADFARYIDAHSQLEALWEQAGRPSNGWERLPLLLRLRQVLAVGPGEEAPNDPRAATPQTPAARPSASPEPLAAARPMSPAQAAAAMAARTAPAATQATVAPTGPVSSPRPEPAPVATAAAPSLLPLPAEVGTATAIPSDSTVVAPAAPALASADRSGGPPKRVPPPPIKVSREQLVEMHSPILNEVGELTKRATEEFKLSQIALGITDCDRSLYLLERVVHAPAAMLNQLNKVMEDAGRISGLVDADRGRLELLKERTRQLLAEPGA